MESRGSWDLRCFNHREQSTISESSRIVSTVIRTSEALTKPSCIVLCKNERDCECENVAEDEVAETSAVQNNYRQSPMANDLISVGVGGGGGAFRHICWASTLSGLHKSRPKLPRFC